MKIKIKGNVIHTGRILKKGAVHEVTDEDGAFLVKAGHADKAADTDATEPLPAGAPGSKKLEGDGAKKGEDPKTEKK